MRLPRMSTGAWIFATAVTVALITAPTVYAAVGSHVAIGNTDNATTSLVDAERQLVTVNGAQPSQIIRANVVSTERGCSQLYQPPAGKAIVVTSITYSLGALSPHASTDVELENGACSAFYDVAETTQIADAIQHNFPTGLPLPSVAVFNDTGDLATVILTGYLIPAAQLPPASALQVSPREFRALLHTGDSN